VPFSPTTTATYTVSGTSAAGCINTDQVLVTVNPIPTVTAGNDVTICVGAAVTLSGGGATTYSWSPAVNNGIAFTPAVGTTTYTVTGTSAGCTNTDQVVVTVNPLPILSAGADVAVCAGQQVTLNASGAVNYSWSGGITNGLALTPNSTTTYTVTGTSAAGCVATDQVLVTVNPIPNVFAGNDVVTCPDQTVVLTGSGAATYTWSPTVTNGVAFTPTAGATTYTVTGTSAAGCTNTDQVLVTVNANLTAAFSPSVTEGCAPLTVTFTNNTANSFDCVWTMSDGTVLTGCTSVTNTFEQAGCYDISLTVTSANGCVTSLTQPDLICVDANPVASFMPSAWQMSELDMNVDFNNTSINATQYIWNFGDTSPLSTEENPSHDYTGNEIGIYDVTLIAISPAGCTDTAYSTIQIYEEVIFYVPNTFTPDDDTYNPIFKPIFTSGYDPFDYGLYIYNRWGEIIFESHNTEIGWDGTYGSNQEIDMVQDGTYTWKIEFKVSKNDERRMEVGHVNVIR
jgi:gliding motility-associated-like protein